jgi:hypothetical protein
MVVELIELLLFSLFCGLPIGMFGLALVVFPS